MTKYIDAERLKAEIERHIKEVKDAAKRFTPNMGFFDAKLSGIYDVIAIVDSLPDNDFLAESIIASKDLEEEIQGMYQAIFGTDIINRREMVYLETFDMIARHFAEWGTKHSK